ncbi:MAG: patatin-like phospholipase family protein [Nocardioides sp.]|jgi:NTE family protein
MTTAFVLSGGGSLGAVQAGMVAALEEQGLCPDVLIGTSAGALNAAYLGAHGFSAGSIADLAELWRGLRRQDVFPVDPLRSVLAFAGKRASLCSLRPLRRLVERHLPIDDLCDAQIPLHVIATDALSGEEVKLSSGDATSAVLASAAIPAVFRPVEHEGRLLIDGGVSNNTAVAQAVALGADRVVVVPAGFACDLSEPPGTPLAAMAHALTLLLEQRLIVEVAHFADEVEIIVAPPLCPLSVNAVDFGHADELIERAHADTCSWLEAGNDHLPNPARFLALHRHDHHHHGPGAGRTPPLVDEEA